jgi:hypothetical protein
VSNGLTAIGGGDDDVRRQHQLDPECEANALDGRDQRFCADPAVQVDRINVVLRGTMDAPLSVWRLG